MSAEEVAIGPAGPDDLPALVALLGLLFAQEAEFRPDPEAQARGLALILGDASVGRILVARADGRVAGMVGLLFAVSTALGARVAWLEDMVVAPEARGRGVGGLLVEAALALARDEGCRRVTLLTDADNAAAQHFYRRHGFTASPMRPFRILL